ncbi:MAG: alpha/beta hydrolase [Leucobacter sp.]
MRVPETADEIVDPATLIVGSVGEITATAAFVQDVADDCAEYRQGVNRAFESLLPGEGVAVHRLRTKFAGKLYPGAGELREIARAAKRGLDRYAAELERIYASARHVRETVDGRLGDIRTRSSTIEDICAKIDAPPPSDWQQPPAPTMPTPRLDSRAEGRSATEQDALRHVLTSAYETQWREAALAWSTACADIVASRGRWDELISERRSAERSLSAALQQTELGQLISVSATGGAQGPKQIVALAISGELWGREGTPGLLRTHPLLRDLLGHDSGEQVWDSPPAPETVAANWDRLDDAEKRRLIGEVPWVIGNLPGIPFRDRDRANRRVIEFYESNPSLLDARGAKALNGLREVLDRERKPPVNVVALDLSAWVPRVAIGYGDLDGADYLTWQVPGMESDADNALDTWDRASRNLYWQQQRLVNKFDKSPSVGTIAFLSYDTPDLSDSLSSRDGVLSPRLAREGSERLAYELDGTWATRNRGGDAPLGFRAAASPHISVNAHSYGTTTAANALTRVTHSVDSFSMAGSAGLDTGTVQSLNDLRVTRNHTGQINVYASHAQADNLAPVGLVRSGRANPNPNISYEKNVNLGGAMHYPSDGFVAADGEVFKKTDGHRVIGEDAASEIVSNDASGGAPHHRFLNEIGFEASAGQGYWDRGTQSLHNLAASSLGLKDEVVGGLYAYSSK